jgi:hypothetical protein
MRQALLVLIVLQALAVSGPLLWADGPQPILLWKNSPGVIDRTARNVPATNEERYQRLRKYFEAVECRGSDLREQAVPKSKQRNLVCTMQGSSSDVIILAAHYDTEGKGEGAVDDWSGAVMLPMIFRAVHATVPQHTLMFVEFDGRRGAREFVDSLSRKERKSIVAVLGIEALGLGTVEFSIDPNEDPGLQTKEATMGMLLDRAADIVGGIQRPGMQRIWGELRVDDTQEFHRLGVPSVLIHSISWETRKIAGSALDTPEAINAKAYYDTYQLLSTYSSYLDRSLGEHFSIHEPLAAGKSVDGTTPLTDADGNPVSGVHVEPPNPRIKQH